MPLLCLSLKRSPRRLLSSFTPSAPSTDLHMQNENVNPVSLTDRLDTNQSAVLSPLASEGKKGSDLKGKAPTGFSLNVGGGTGCCQTQFQST